MKIPTIDPYGEKPIALQFETLQAWALKHNKVFQNTNGYCSKHHIEGAPRLMLIISALLDHVEYLDKENFSHRMELASQIKVHETIPMDECSDGTPNFERNKTLREHP